MENDRGRVRRGVIGIIEQDGKYLMIRRAERITRGGTWCFPGGHVERQETSREAIRRELQEELRICVNPTQRLGAIRVLGHNYVLVVWRVMHISGSMQPAKSEIADIRWVSLSNIPTISPGLPSNLRVWEMLIDDTAERDSATDQPQIRHSASSTSTRTGQRIR